jgi:hypothetical protein
MEVLTGLFIKSRADRVTRGMEAKVVKHQCNLNSDDVILFAHPDKQLASTIKDILHIFGEFMGYEPALASV